MHKEEEAIIAKVATLEEDLIHHLQELLRIPSLKADPQEAFPFGKAVHAALDYALNLATKMGLRVTNCDNYMGYASYGESSDYICAMGHLDVVPADEPGWKSAPFEPHRVDNRLYARGVLDNKGATMASLYALYALKELGITFDHEIRVIFGCDEESGFHDLVYYLTKEKPPLAGFTPDCKFPVIYSERGRLLVRIHDESNDWSTFFTFVNQHFLTGQYDGASLHIDYHDAEYGALELRNYRLGYSEDHPYLEMSIRYPANAPIDTIQATLMEKIAPYRLEVVTQMDPVLVDKESPLIQLLAQSYHDVTGYDATPEVTSGGTYAKMMPNIVAFGPSLPTQEGSSHAANEWMYIEDIITNAKIYAIALYRLAKHYATNS